MLSALAAIGLPFIPSGSELRPFAPDLWIIATIIAVLLTPFFVKRSNAACALVALVGLIVALISLIVGGMPSPKSYFVGMLVIDPFAVMWKGLLIVFVIGVIVMWFSTSAQSLHEGDGPEFFTLLLGATLGMSLMASTSNLLMLFMAVELASLPSYVLAGFRKTNRIGAEASLKYVLFGAATSAIMVYGLSILYGLYGTLQIEQLATAMIHSTSGSALLVIGIFGLIVGIGFKVSAVPFHFWCPDVFEGAHIEVTTFLSVASKGAALALLLRVMMIIASAAGFHDVPGISLSAIAIVIGIIGAVTATVGNTAAYVQTNIKRLLAYSSIAHAGYMLCAVSLLIDYKLSANAGGIDPASAAAQTLLLYLAVYLFMNLGAFTVAGAVLRATGSEKIEDYANLGTRSPLLAACLTGFMFSLVGIPPFAGFVAKLNVMLVLGENGGWWWALVVVIGINTIFSLYYYMRVVRVMYLSRQRDDVPRLPTNLVASAIAVVCAVVLVAMLIGYGPMKSITQDFSKMQLSGKKTVAGSNITALVSR